MLGNCALLTNLWCRILPDMSVEVLHRLVMRGLVKRVVYHHWQTKFDGVYRNQSVIVFFVFEINKLLSVMSEYFYVSIPDSYSDS